MHGGGIQHDEPAFTGVGVVLAADLQGGTIVFYRGHDPIKSATLTLGGLASLIEATTRLFVHCHAGRSRPLATFPVTDVQVLPVSGDLLPVKLDFGQVGEIGFAIPVERAREMVALIQAQLGPLN